MSFKYFNVKNGLTTGNISLHSANANVQANYFIGNISVTSSANLGDVGNVKITGGTGGYVLQTDGTGNLSWVAQSGGGSSSISNGNSNVNIPSANGNINFSAVGNTVMVVTGTGANISGTANVNGNLITGNANLGNAVTANYFIGSGNNLSNISGSNVTGTVANATYAISAGSATTAGTVTTNAQPNITSVGNLSSLTVDNGTYGNVVITQFGSIYASGNGSNPYSIMQVISNDTTTGMGMRAYAGLNGQIYSNSGITFTTGATIRDKDYPTGGTSRATLDSTGLTVTGNITSGNANLGNLVTANYFVGSGNNLSNISGGNITGQVANALVAGTVYTNAQPNITSVGTLTSLTVSGSANVGNLGATGTGSFGGNVAMNSFNITSLATPVNDTDAATKGYVDSVAQGLDPKASVIYATTTSLFGSGYTYNNGTSGVGATLTSSTNGALSIDGSTPTIGARVLLKNEAGAYVNTTTESAAFNGIYTVTQVGSGILPFILTRSTDFDIGTEMSGAFVFVEAGSTLADTGWVCTTNNPITVGTTQIIWVQFSGAGTYQAGTGLTLTGTTFSVNASQTQITTVGTLTSLDVNGTVTAAAFTANTGVFTGNGNGLSSIVGANVTGQVGNALISGTVYTNAQPNITSVGTLSSLVVTGNISSGNANLGNNVSANFFTGTLTTNVQPNITSVGSLTGLTVSNATGVVNFTTTANVTLGAVANLHISGGSSSQYLQTDGAGNLSWSTVSSGAASNIANGNSTVNIPSANGNINFTAVGNTVMVITGTGVNVAGTLNTGTGNANVGNLGTAQVLASANITTPQFISNIATGTAPFVVTSTTQVANLNVATAGTVTTAAQPNITSVGNLSGLTVSNATGTVNFTTTANVSLGAIANLHITGGSNTYVLSTDGSGNLSWSSASGTNIAVDDFTGNGVQTAYTLTATPANINYTLVSIAGTFQPRTVYSLTGNVITFSSAPPNTAPIEVTTFTTGTGGGGGGITAQDLLSPFLLMGA